MSKFEGSAVREPSTRAEVVETKRTRPPLPESHRQGCPPSHFFFCLRQGSQLLRMPFKVGVRLPRLGASPPSTPLPPDEVSIPRLVTTASTHTDAKTIVCISADKIRSRHPLGARRRLATGGPRTKSIHVR